ncbi:hypothetical protein FWF74_02435 [Candidatus Saccharibacteria bacterium]|nr:hypothetical protein [Candidatus Saccharibacteria bacterium]MCL1962970.1 hypothetical protein [Candidatus Saccharibacteria bacterium]
MININANISDATGSLGAVAIRTQTYSDIRAWLADPRVYSDLIEPISMKNKKCLMKMLRAYLKKV